MTGYLKLLEIENFKSWRGRQVIGPFKRFNCIIGPNGSGKSNVMDALSFAMAERTAHLRVKHVRDLIHGAHIGKPVSSIAKVTMVYSEVNGEEKTFSRVITGLSTEFLFNGSSISRADYIYELEKIGVIVKARNCLVFQGAVESIAVKKPKERTQLFEQISNSSELADEYERKKNLMQKAEEDAHFTFTKKKNLAAERKQAKQEKEEAEQYQALVEELQENQIQLHLFQLFHNEMKIHSLASDLDSKTTNMENQKGQSEAAEDEVRAKKRELGRLRREQQQIEKELKTQEAALNEKRPNYIKAKENTSHYIKKIEASNKSLMNCRKQCTRQMQLIEELENGLSEVEKVSKDFEMKVEEEFLSRGTDVQLAESQLEQYKYLKEQVRRKDSTLAQQLEKLRWEQKTDQEKMEFDQRRLKEVEINIKQTEQQIEDLKKRTEKIEEYINNCKSSLNEQKQKEEGLAYAVESAKSRMQEVNEELGTVVSELQNAKIDHHEGSRQRRRAEITESLKRLYPDSVYGRLFELCQPVHKKYQLAVTKIFGRYMNAIVITTEKVARDCIRFLKEERAEPETFLALDYLNIKPINEKLREIKSAKMVIDVVQCGLPQLRRVVQFVCGNGLVCETLKEARQVAFDGPERLKTVSLDGTLFSKSGIISGGSSDLRFKARQWEEKELERLKERKEQLTDERLDLMKIKRKESDLKHLQVQIQGIQTRLRYSQTELDLIKKKQLMNWYKEKSRLESELTNFEFQLLMVKNAVEEREQKMEEVMKQMKEVEDNIFQEFCVEVGLANIREYEDEHVKQQEDIDRKRSEFENQMTRLKVQLDYNQDQLEKERIKIQKLEDSLQKDEEEVANLKKVLELLKMDTPPVNLIFHVLGTMAASITLVLHARFFISEFENQMTRLKVQLDYNQDQLEKERIKIQKLEDSLQKDEEEVANLKKVFNYLEEMIV
ncbi:structural maintenance of chromosomes protein 1B [Protopterus annectens]|uniref:structural maintenance of chromosomes protein 1B n=1 Tax=Protopterus annectens TaxID=7888 RepID=UPI001CFA9951|nr:structural maintenance of chromosomes protein 1B [Protopterus annectens]